MTLILDKTIALKGEYFLYIGFLRHYFLCNLLLMENLLQVTRLNSSYPGGLASYIKTARELLADSKAGRNPFDGFTPSVSQYRSHM